MLNMPKWPNEQIEWEDMTFIPLSLLSLSDFPFNNYRIKRHFHMVNQSKTITPQQNIIFSDQEINTAIIMNLAEPHI